MLRLFLIDEGPRQGAIVLIDHTALRKINGACTYSHLLFMRFLRFPETEKKKKSQALVKGGGIGSTI